MGLRWERQGLVGRAVHPPGQTQRGQETSFRVAWWGWGEDLSVLCPALSFLRPRMGVRPSPVSPKPRPGCLAHSRTPDWPSALRAPPEGPAVGSPFPCQSPLLRRLLLALTSLAVVRQGSRGDSHVLFVFPHGPCGNGPCNGYSATPSYDDSCGKTYLFAPLSSAPKVLHSLGDLQDPSSTWQQTHP